MDYKKAHKILERKQRMMTNELYRHNFSDDDIQSNELAIEALEKQIPKKLNI